MKTKMFSIGDLKVSLQREPLGQGGPKTEVLYDRSESGANLYRNRNLLEYGFTQSDFSVDASWCLMVEDHSSGDSGTVDFFRVQLNGNTDPLSSDSDYDGLNDSEETQLGNDGYITCPMSADSDADGLNDYQETYGSSVIGMKTNPTCADSDQDGFSDSIDNAPSGDLVLHVGVMTFGLHDPIPWQFGNDYYANAFVRLRGLGHDYSTTRLYVETGDTVTFGMNYYFDLHDDAVSATVYVEAWADMTFGDTQIDIGNGGGTLNMTVNVPIYRGFYGYESRGFYNGDVHADPDPGPEGSLSL
ncbi:MAG: hypothetical protein LUO79_07590, partial [Methanomassiliicoccales archaeon]|nr:hypothetical protein [Methanomassiliicoccales archaeon]